VSVCFLPIVPLKPSSRQVAEQFSSIRRLVLCR
jgi:hypothetical protein